MFVLKLSGIYMILFLPKCEIISIAFLHISAKKSDNYYCHNNVTIVGRAITIERAIQKSRQEPLLNKTATKKKQRSKTKTIAFAKWRDR